MCVESQPLFEFIPKACVMLGTLVLLRCTPALYGRKKELDKMLNLMVWYGHLVLFRSPRDVARRRYYKLEAGLDPFPTIYQPMLSIQNDGHSKQIPTSMFAKLRNDVIEITFLTLCSLKHNLEPKTITMCYK